METAFTACAPAASLLSQNVPSVGSLLLQPRAAQPSLKKTTFHSECDFQSEFLPKRSFSAKTSETMVSNGTNDIVVLSSYYYDPMYNGATDEVAWWRHPVRYQMPDVAAEGEVTSTGAWYNRRRFGDMWGYYTFRNLRDREDDYCMYSSPYTRSYANDWSLHNPYTDYPPTRGHGRLPQRGYSSNMGYGSSRNGNSGYGYSRYANTGYGNSGYGNSRYANSWYGDSGYGHSYRH